MRKSTASRVKNNMTFFKYTWNKLNSSNGIGPTVNEDNKIISQDAEKVIAFNTYFCSVFRKKSRLMYSNLPVIMK